MMKRTITQMETVVPVRGDYGTYRLAGTHRNTVRLAAPKYALSPGDYVQMSYVFKPGGAPIATEFLRVKSIATATCPLQHPGCCRSRRRAEPARSARSRA